MAYDPDFWKKNGTTYPALSSSIQYTQGAEVKSAWFAQRTLPLLGRGPNQTWFRLGSHASGSAVNISARRFFDDSIVGKVAVLHGSLDADLSSDDGTLETRFSYFYDGFTLGMTDVDPIESHPYREKNYFDPVQFLENPDQMTWPIVLEDPAAIDILDYNGVIEPLTIRTVIGMSSTFVGDNLDPEPHGIRAGIGGNYVWEPYNRYNPITEYFTPQDSSRNYPFAYVVDWRIYEGFARNIPDFAYTMNDDEVITPFVEKTAPELIFSKISDEAVRDYYIYKVPSASLDSRPSVDSKSKPRGFTYENCEFGTDSLAFGGLLK